MTGRRRRARAPFLALAAAGAGIGAWLGPDALSELGLLPVQTVEVHGARFVDPYDVVRAAGLDAGATLFDRASSWRSAARSHPHIDDARFRRVLPDKVVIEVQEPIPVALVPGVALRPVDLNGRVLAMEPAGEALDLPVLTGVVVMDGVVDDAGQSALRALAALTADHPELADRLSQMDVSERWLRLVFRDRAPDAFLPLDPTPDQLTQLRLALADLSARGELATARRVDVRFRDQVVVSFLRTPVSRR